MFPTPKLAYTFLNNEKTVQQSEMNKGTKVKMW